MTREHRGRLEGKKFDVKVDPKTGAADTLVCMEGCDGEFTDREAFVEHNCRDVKRKRKESSGTRPKPRPKKKKKKAKKASQKKAASSTKSDDEAPSKE